MDADMMITSDPNMETAIQLEKFPESFDFNLEKYSSCHDHDHDHDQVQFSGFPPSLSSIPGNNSRLISSSPSNNKFKFGDFGSLLLPNVAKTSSPQLDQMEKRNSNMIAMREMIFRIAAMQPIHIDPESVKPPKRRNVKISKDPQSVAARHRRERISERIRILQRLVPGGTKMDTASMLDEAIHYVKFLQKQVQCLEQVSATANNNNNNNRFRSNIGNGLTNGSLMGNNGISGYSSSSSLLKGCQHNKSTHHMVSNLQMLR